jgi:putative transposase
MLLVKGVCFPVQDDEHFFTVCRYVERNAPRAKLVRRAEQSRWGSLWRWLQGPGPAPQLLSAWPAPRLPNWVDRVNEALTDGELQAIRRSVQHGSPFGDPQWIESTARRLGLQSTLRSRGRPQIRFPNENPINES